jgi:putative CocE/NonD family hydrolase
VTSPVRPGGRLVRRFSAPAAAPSGAPNGAPNGAGEKYSPPCSVYIDNESLRAPALDCRFGVEVHSGQAVLRADVYRRAGGAPSAVMLMRTPYGTARPAMMQLARALTAHGLAVVLQNVRGRHGSGGVFEPFAAGTEVEDGEATLAWLDAQPWADGRVIGLGVSYSTYTAAALCATSRARRRPLCGLLSLAGMTDPYHHFYSGGAFRVHWALPWYLLVRGRGQADPGLRDLRRLALGDLAAVPVRAGAAESPWRDWIAHPHPADAYWRRRDLTGVLAATGLPMLHIGGMYDFSLASTLALYERMSCAAPAGSQRLVLGPWEHNQVLAELVLSLRAEAAEGAAAAPQSPAAQPGGCEPSGLGRELRSALASWLGTEGSAAAHGGVRIAFGTAGGASEWRELARWPAAAARRRWLLAPGALLPDDGTPLPPAPPLRWDHRPETPVPSHGGRCWQLAGWTSAGPLDQRAVEERADVLVFASAELAADLEVCGRGRVKLTVAAPAAVADFCVKLVDLDPAGAARWVADGVVRIAEEADSAGDGPGAVAGDGGERRLEIAIDLEATCHLFRRGHRVGLEIAASSFPQYDCTREPGARRLFTGGARPSCLELPVPCSDSAHSAASPQRHSAKVADTADTASQRR